MIELGYLTIEASNADEALDLLANVDEISVLLSDVVMPGSMNGYGLATRALEQNPDLCVLLMSAYADGHSAGGTKQPVPILRKPFDNEELLCAITRQAARHPAPAKA